MSDHSKSSYFSVAFDLVVKDKELPFDLYINSSAKEGKDRFVRIFPTNGYLEAGDLKEFKTKYLQLYILEEQRDLYLKSLVNCTDAPDVKKAAIIKDSAIHYLGKVFDKDKEFTTEVLEEAIEGCRESVESMIDVVQDYDIAKLSDLIGELSFHDFYTFDHSINVSMYSISIYKALNPLAKRDEITMAGLGGLLHDLGKIKIPNSIINSPGDLTEDDFKMIKKHPDYGYEMLGDKALKTDEGVDINIVRRVVHEHHENFNGTGYPNGLKEKEIHILARVTATADFFDAITTKRSYHEVLSVEDAIEVMRKTVGKKLDPKVFKVFEKVVASGQVVKKSFDMSLPESFDPCQPQNVLPFRKDPVNDKKKSNKKNENKEDHGKVKSDFGFGSKVKKSAS